jgi:hypothetical protein
MRHGSIQHISVWLDDLSSDHALASARDWADRLGLPLRVTEAAIAEAAIDEFLRPGGLCVVDGHRGNAVREALLARLASAPDTPVLLTPARHQPLSRVLIVHDPQDAGAGFLESAARLCQALEIPPLILTVAASEQEALFKQGCAEDVCARLGMQADFDAAVSFDVRAAVDRAAQWRHCSHVFFERTNRTPRIPLWRRARDVFSQWRGVSDTLALLALPASLVLDFPKKTSARRVGQPWGSPSSASPVSTNGTAANGTAANGIPSEVTRDQA